MKILDSTRRKAAVGAVGVVAALGIGGTAYAATTSGSPSPSSPVTSPSSNGKGHSHKGSLLERADHVTYEVKVKGQWVTYSLDRGKVTAATPTSITLTRPDGTSVTEGIVATTKFAGVTSESAVTVGKPARVVSDNGVAIRVAQRSATPSTPSTSAQAPA